MLVLSRRRNEAIVIDHPKGPVTVVLVEIRGDKARIGVTADKSVLIHRFEVWEKVKPEQMPRFQNRAETELVRPNLKPDALDDMT